MIIIIFLIFLGFSFQTSSLEKLYRLNFSYPFKEDDLPLNKEDALRINDYFDEIHFDFFIIRNKVYDEIFDFHRKKGMGNLCALVEFGVFSELVTITDHVLEVTYEQELVQNIISFADLYIKNEDGDIKNEDIYFLTYARDIFEYLDFVLECYLTTRNQIFFETLKKFLEYDNLGIQKYFEEIKITF